MAETIWNNVPPPPRRQPVMASYLAAGMIALLGAGLVGNEWRAQAPPPSSTLAQAVSEFDAGHLDLATAAFRKLAGAGNATAAYWYGYALDQGLGTAVDAKASIAEYRQALAGGVTRAGTKLGELYREGNIIPADYARARAYFTEAAGRGDAEAALRLGNMMRDGIGGPADKVQAYAWLEIAALRGNAQARIDRDTLLPTLSPAQQAAASQAAIGLDAARPNNAPDGAPEAKKAAATPPAPAGGNTNKTGA